MPCCIVCPSTLFRPRDITPLLIWRQTTGVYYEEENYIAFYYDPQYIRFKKKNYLLCMYISFALGYSQCKVEKLRSVIWAKTKFNFANRVYCCCVQFQEDLFLNNACSCHLETQVNTPMRRSGWGQGGREW